MTDLELQDKLYALVNNHLQTNSPEAPRESVFALFAVVIRHCSLLSLFGTDETILAAIFDESKKEFLRITAEAKRQFTDLIEGETDENKTTH